MTEMMNNTIYSLAMECRYICNNKISLRKNVVPGNIPGLTYIDYDIFGDIASYECALRSLYNAIRDKYPVIAKQLDDHMYRYNNDKIIHLSAIDAIVECIIALEEKQGKKIFISHSSKDKVIVNAFVNNILQLGIGIDYRDIFCTSIEEMSVRNGESIRKHIHENIKSADFSFLLISNNYKKSEICINEMGAVWAYNANVRLYLLPNSEFNEIGWLCEPQKADKINSREALTHLFSDMTDFYNLPKDVNKWSSQVENFLCSIGQ